MEEKLKIDTWLHWNMSFVGGFFGAYALINRLGTFGSSETANMIYIVTSLLWRNLPEGLIRLAALLIYVLGIELTVFLPKYIKVDMRFVAVFVDTVAILVIARLPEDLNFMVALYPIFFATAVQWCVFGGARGYTSASIFSTNNLKQTAISFGEYILTGDRAKLDKFKFFGSTIIAFHLGVIYVWFSSSQWGLAGAYTCLIPLFVAWLSVMKVRKIEKQQNCM
jgi:uncharacterized membrane protein YoaK (UPF0700 family)